MQSSQPGLNTFPGIILFVKENTILLYFVRKHYFNKQYCSPKGYIMKKCKI